MAAKDSSIGFGVLLLALCISLLASCTGGSDSSNISSNNPSFAEGVLALSVAEKVTVVDAKDSGVSSSSVEKGAKMKAAALGAELAPYDIPGGTPYYTDSTRIWVSERSAEVFDSVNNVLCLVSKMDYEDMLNQGDYVAQLDMSKCENQTDAAGRVSESQESSGSEGSRPVYTRWVINSSRADRSSPHIVKAWVEMVDNGGAPQGIIYVLMTITEAKSESNPLGIFRLDYGGHAYLPGTTTPDTSNWIMRGFLQTRRDEATGDVLLYYSSDEENEPGRVRINKAVLNRDRDAGTGEGSVYAYHEDPENPTEEDNYDFFYSDTHFLRGIYNATTTVYDSKSCYSRYFFDEAVHRYGLYNSTGQRVQHNSGMSLLYNDGANDYYGWIGYYGLWFPDQVSITNGTTVYSVKYDQTTSAVIKTPYETFISGGKLIKFERGSIQLQEIGSVPLTWSDDLSGTWTNYIAIWNPATEKFQKTASVDYDSGTTTDIPDEDIDLNWFFDNYYYYNVTFWSDSLGGYVRLDLMDPTTGGYIAPTNLTTVVTYNVSVVYPGSADPDLETYGLVCFDRCLDPTPGIINSTDPFHIKSTDGSINQQADVLPVGPANPNIVNAVTYSFNSASMQLVDEATGLDVILNEPSLYSNSNSIQAGAMIVNTPANLQNLECSSSVSNYLCSWKIWDNSPVFYTWETGTDSWNRLTALKNTVSGDFVTFNPPIKVEYVHIATDPSKPDYKYNGSKFFLQYYGFGDLQGIPGECTDKETGESVPCGSDSWWTPSFSIPTGTELKEAGPDGAFGTGDDISYLSKALEKEQKMKKTSTLLPCDTFTLSHYTLPEISEWLEPAIGSMPGVTAPPKVIDGELL